MARKKSKTAGEVVGGKTTPTEGKCEGDSAPERMDRGRARVTEANTDPGSTSRSPVVPSFVLLSDLHAHPWSAFAKGDGKNNTRLQRSLKILDQSLARAAELNVPWVFAGDIVHTAGFALNVVLTELVEVLVRYADVPKLTVWGNHDARGIGGKITLEQTVLSTLRRAVPNLIVLDPAGPQILYDSAGGLTFSGAGYQPRQELLEYAMPSDVGVYHQTVRGTKAPHGFALEQGIPAGELLERHRISVVGHVHHWQYVPHWDPERVVLVPGSPEHHNFGDIGEHGWWVVHVGKDLLSVDFVPGGSPEFRTVATSADVKADGHFYRVQALRGGEVLPESAVAIAPTVTTVQSRDTLRGVAGDQILETWLRTNPPTSGISVEEHFNVGRELLGSRELGNLRPYRMTRLRMRNFCSYEAEELRIQDGTWLVLGKGRDFPSNGAGKSSLFEAIFWALFGRTTKGLSGDEVIRWGADDCEVLLEFETADDAWLQVIRCRGKASVLRVTYGTGEITGGTLEGKSVNEVTEKLGCWLGITPELFQALVYFSQEKLLLFASATDGERKDMLADLIGLGAYQDAVALANKKAAAWEADVQRASAFFESSKSRVEAEVRRLEDIRLKVQSWDVEQAERVYQAQGAVVQFDKQLDAARAMMLESALQQLSASHKERLEQGRVALQEAASAVRVPTQKSTTEELAAVQKEYTQAVADLRALQGRMGGREQHAAYLRAKIKVQRESLGLGKCPTCGQVVTEAHQALCLAPLEDEVAAVEAEIGTLRDEQKPLADQAAQLHLRVDVVVKGVEAWRAYELAEQAYAAAQKAMQQLEKEGAELAASAAWHVDKTLAEHRQALERKVAAINTEQNPYTREEVATEERLREAEREVAQWAGERKRLLEAIAVYDYWQHGFSKQGIQSLLVDEVAALFNKTRGMIFPALTQGVYDVQFSTLSQTRAGEWREKTEFQVYEHGQLVPYAALSGGQRRRIDVGVMLTLVKAVSEWMQVPGVLGMLVLDEVFGFLDASGAEGLMEALREVQLQIPKIFVVSHDAQLQAMFSDTLIVEQDDRGISRVVVG